MPPSAASWSVCTASWMNASRSPRLLDDRKRLELKRMRGLVKQAQYDAGLEATGDVHIPRHTRCRHLAMETPAPTVIQALDRPLPKGFAPEEAVEAEGPSFGRILAAT